MASVYKERARELERFETQFGVERGRLAVAQDLLTDALSQRKAHRCPPIRLKLEKMLRLPPRRGN